MMTVINLSPSHAEVDRLHATGPEEILDQLWDQGKRPDLRDFLAPWLDRGLDLEDLLAVLRVDQRRRWFSGQRVDVSDYQSLFPMLGEESEAMFELVYYELLIRVEIGESPDPREYARAFPEFATRLKLQIEVHQAFSLDDAPLRGTEDVGAQAEPEGRMPSLPGYTVLCEIGRGGMGVVYRAKQHKPSRTVALKMILDGRFASGQDLLRFQNETEAVAALDHPNIVPILEVGQHDRLHYFSMRLLTGGNLAEALSRLADDPKAVAQLLVEIAGAVHHAHQRGVLHRDLKPANILLDDEGHAHITDFGLAKRVCVHACLTRVGAILGSPGYMAPEQAMGDLAKVTTATDVYGLGAILYSLLTGRAPFEGTSDQETIYRLCSDLPEPPTSLNRAVPRPLEVICLKCLEKDPGRRYSSAAAVADDLRRWQAGEPIIARPVPAVVRAWLWVRRHPSQAVLATALFCTLLTGFAGMFALWRDAERTIERLESSNEALMSAKARERDALSRAQKGFALSLDVVQSLFAGKSGEGSVLQVPDEEGLRSKLLKRAVELHERLEKSLKSDPSPVSLVMLADSYSQLGGLAVEVESTDIALSAYDRALEIRRDLSNQYPADYRRQIEVAKVLGLRGWAERKADRKAGALESYRQEAAIYEELVRSRPDDEELLDRQAWSLQNVAVLMRMLGRPREALILFEQVLGQRQELVRRHPEHFGYRAVCAFCVAEVGSIQSAIPERRADAIALLERARVELEHLHGEQPRHADVAWWLTDCLQSLWEAYQTNCQTEASLQATDRASCVILELVTCYPKFAPYRERHAWINHRLSDRQSSLGVPARAALARAVASLEYLVGVYPGVDRYRVELALALVRQAGLARDAGDLAIAESSARLAVEHAELVARSAQREADFDRAAGCHLQLAVVLLDRGRRAEAEVQVRAAEEKCQLVKHPDAMVVYDLACARAMLSAIAITESDRATLADKAMAALHLSTHWGFRNVSHIRRDTDLTALRPRKDFQLLLYDLEFPVDPFAN